MRRATFPQVALLPAARLQVVERPVEQEPLQVVVLAASPDLLAHLRLARRLAAEVAAPELAVAEQMQSMRSNSDRV